MCRFVLYMGPELKIGQLVTEPVHSIIVQSYHSEERDEPLNGDGFGIAWYPDKGDREPAVFRSISPAWNNQNLKNLSRVVYSSCILAHIRAASPGLPVAEFNCHPFSREKFCFMHNGAINQFHKVKRQLIKLLSDASYLQLQGTTDSEVIFALFADQYALLDMDENEEKLAKALKNTLRVILNLCAHPDIGVECELNIVVTDGNVAVVSRFSSEGVKPVSLYVHAGHEYRCHEGVVNLYPANDAAVLVASEPLTADNSWQKVPQNHLLLINEKRQINYQAISF